MLMILVVLNRLHVMTLWAYLVPAIVLWWFLLHSGVHPTVAGVLIALTIPARRWPARPEKPQSPLHVLEHGLQGWVAFVILPLFALANAGVSFAGFKAGDLLAAAPLGVALGLFFGKQIGVFGAAWLAIRLGVAERPAGASWRQLYGVAILCGIGFTMSLFMAALAFARSPERLAEVKLAILLGSIISAVTAMAVLVAAPRHAD
jgi:NhaA family Na+:H+ antiporter